MAWIAAQRAVRSGLRARMEVGSVRGIYASVAGAGSTPVAASRLSEVLRPSWRVAEEGTASSHPAGDMHQPGSASILTL